MVEPFARIQEERTAQLTMATKFRHKLLQRLHGVVARWNCIIFVPNMIGIGESYFPSHLIHKYPGWRVVIKTRIIFGDILPWVYQQSLHYTIINYIFWSNVGWSADQAWHPVGAHQLLGMETSQRGARCNLCAIICKNPQAKWWHEFTISRY